RSARGKLDRIANTMLNESIRYVGSDLYCDDVATREIAEQVGTPVYIYTLRRALSNFARIQAALASTGARIHPSLDTNGNLPLLRALAQAGAAMDAVSGGEIYRALLAGTDAGDIVFAGVGKTRADLRYALESGVGWFN